MGLFRKKSDVVSRNEHVLSGFIGCISGAVFGAVTCHLYWLISMALGG